MYRMHGKTRANIGLHLQVQDNQSAISKIVLNHRQRHITPTEARTQECMFCPHVTQTPRLSRHHTNIGVSMMQDIELREVSGERDETLSALLELMRAELYFQHPPSGPYIQGIAQALAIHLSRAYRTSARRHHGGLQAYKLHRVFKAMHEELAHPFDLARLAGLAELSEFHFSRVFKQSTGLSPSHYFIRLRMEAARRLLSETEDSMISIALTVGYNSPSHFAAIFRKHTGISPSQYRHENMRSKTPTV